MSQPRVLLVGTDSQTAQALASAEELIADHGLAADVIGSVKDSLSRLSEIGYSAVICWAERQDELATMIRIRKANPDLPIMLFTPQEDSAFLNLARQMGATRVLRPGQNALETAATIRNAVVSGELLDELRSKTRDALKHAKDLRVLAQEDHDLARIARHNVHKGPRLSFIPLVVEGNPGMAFQVVGALQKADVFAPLPILRTREEAVAFLSDLLQPVAQAPRLAPSILLLDGDLENDAALELLRWVRSHATFSHLPVVLFSSSSDAARIARAYELGINSYLLKPADFEAHVQCLTSLKTYWGSFNQGPTPY